MKLIALLLLFPFFLAAQTPPPDTLRGIALVLIDQPDPDAVPTLQIAKVYSVQAAVAVKAPISGGITATGTATKWIYFYPDGTSIPNEDILVFKKRPWKK